MKKIVLIEDSTDVRETTQELLELADYEVFSAGDGKEGVRLVKEKKPDLVLCDIMMPDLDGYGVLHILSRNPETSTIPFIFLTAKSDMEDLRKGMNLGADDYITKPSEETILLNAIEARLKKNEGLSKEFEPDINGLNAFINEARGLESLKVLSENRKTRTYKKKESIYREGDYANYTYFIITGRVKCYKTDGYGKVLVNDIHNAGEFIGYMTLLGTGDYHETATAMDYTEVSVIPKQDFLALIQKNRDVAGRFIKMLSGDVIDKEKRLLRLAYASVRERVADVLLELQKKESSPNEPASKVRISREDLASIIGTAKESLIRTLSELKHEGLVDTDGQEIAIRDTEGLKKVASGFG